MKGAYIADGNTARGMVFDIREAYVNCFRGYIRLSPLLLSPFNLSLKLGR
jgi:hypothetical protein